MDPAEIDWRFESEEARREVAHCPVCVDSPGGCEECGYGEDEEESP